MQQTTVYREGEARLTLLKVDALKLLKQHKVTADAAPRPSQALLIKYLMGMGCVRRRKVQCLQAVRACGLWASSSWSALCLSPSPALAFAVGNGLPGGEARLTLLQVDVLKYRKQHDCHPQTQLQVGHRALRSSLDGSGPIRSCVCWHLYWSSLSAAAPSLAVPHGMRLFSYVLQLVRRLKHS